MPHRNQVIDEQGQTMTEFAMVMPLLIVLLLGVVQFGILFNNYVTLTDAARAASRKGVVSRGLLDPRTACENAGYAAGSGLKNPRVDFVVTCNSTWKSGTDVTVTAQYPWKIKLLDWVVADGKLTTVMKERVE